MTRFRIWLTITRLLLENRMTYFRIDYVTRKAKRMEYRVTMPILGPKATFRQHSCADPPKEQP